MKNLVFNNSDSSIIVDYNVDLIGTNDALTVYQIKQNIDGVESIIKGTGGTKEMDSTLSGLGFPDDVDEWTLAAAKVLANTANYTLKVYEEGEDTVTLHTLTEE